jgi:hypothetical protein
VNSGAEGDINVAATSLEDITSVAAGIAVGGSAGVGVNAAVHVLDISTRAFIGDDPDELTASAGAGDVHAHGTVRVAADDRTELNKYVATVAVGGSAGVGAAAAVTVITKHTQAFIGDGASVTGDGQTAGLNTNTGVFGVAFLADSAGSTGLESTTAKDTPISTLQAAGKIHAPDVNNIDTNGDQSGGTVSPASTGARTLTPVQATVRGVAVSATNRDDVKTFSAAIGGGTVGVAVAAAVNVVNTDTQAYIGDGASVNSDQSGANAAQTVSVSAGNDFHHLALAAGAGFGALGVAPGVDVTVLANHTTAAIGSGADVHAMDDVRVDAHASEDILMVGIGIAAGTVGVGGGVSVLSFNNQTYASIAGSVSAGGDAVVRVSDDTGVTVVSGGLGAGLVGAGASVGVLLINKDTQAFIADGATVDAKGGGAATAGVFDGTLTGGDNANGFNAGSRDGVIVQAKSSEKLLQIDVSAGAGFVGVSGAVGVSVIDSNTQAWIGNADVNQTSGNAGAGLNQGVYVGAANEARITTFTGALAGGFVGLGGAVNVGVLKNDVNAQIRSGAVVTARNDVEVNALGIKEIDGFLLSGAGGFVGVAGAVSVWSVGTPLERSYTDANSNGSDKTTADALQRNKEGGGTDTADHDAAQQGESASGMVGGQMSSFDSHVTTTNDGRDSSDERLAAITKSSATQLSSHRPSAAAVTSSMAAAVPATAGTAALIAGGAQVTAGDAIRVNANEDLELDLMMGGVAAFQSAWSAWLLTSLPPRGERWMRVAWFLSPRIWTKTFTPCR